MNPQQKEIQLFITYTILTLIFVIFLKFFSFTPTVWLTKSSLVIAIFISFFFNFYLYFLSVQLPFPSAKNLANTISKPFRILLYWIIFPLYTALLVWSIIGGILPMIYTQLFGQTSTKIYKGTVDSTAKKYCATQFEFKSLQLDHFFFRQCLNPKTQNLKAFQNITIHATVQSSHFGSIIKKIYSIDHQ